MKEGRYADHVKLHYIKVVFSNVCLQNRERTPQFIVQAFLAGPKNVNLQETGPSWLKFEQTLASFEGTKR